MSLYENYTSPWLDDELRMLQDAANKFYRQEFLPLNEKWLAQGKLDRDAGTVGCRRWPPVTWSALSR